MICSKCSNAFDAALPQSVNVSESPEIKDAVLDGSFFVANCPECGTPALKTGAMVYHDPAERLLLVLSPTPLTSPGLEGYTCRRVPDAGSLIEKVKIFNAGFDDVVMELCKYVTQMELGKDVKLKFLRTEGADSEIVLTYPENGSMQMIAIGSNVYSDCEGIVSRNPVMREKAAGLVLVDSEWIARFLK